MTPDNGPSWLLENLVRETPGAQSALLCSRDGLRLERYELTVTQADTLSSLLSGLYSLGRGTGKVLVDDPFGTVHQILVEHPLGLLAVMDAGDNALLGVLATGDCDPGGLGYAMTQMIKKLSPHLGTPARTGGQVQ